MAPDQVQTGEHIVVTLTDAAAVARDEEVHRSTHEGAACRLLQDGPQLHTAFIDEVARS